MRSFSGAAQSVVTGALRDWLVGRGDPVEGLILRAFIPVSQRARFASRIGETGCPATSATCRSARPIPVSGCSRSGARWGTTRPPGAAAALVRYRVLADRLPAAVHRVAAPVPSLPFTLDGAELE
ncbi:MAG: hypothetical protein ACRDRI_07300 [Pseudonocardiaceae bacterium]